MELKEKCRQVGNYPLPTQMVFVEKPDMEAEVKNTKAPQAPAIKHKSRMVICGNRQPWEADERTSTNNLDAALLRWMLSLSSKQVAWRAGKLTTFPGTSCLASIRLMRTVWQGFASRRGPAKISGGRARPRQKVLITGTWCPRGPRTGEAVRSSQAKRWPVINKWCNHKVERACPEGATAWPMRSQF
eukprot:4066741-Amphidinium_carterae.1